MDAPLMSLLPRKATSLLWFATFALILPGLAACDGDSGSPTAAAPGGPQLASTEYRIAPQDTLLISVYQVPNMTRELQVDANGKIDMALIGTVQAAGLTAREAEAEIAKRLGARFIQSPQVSIAVKDGLDLRFTVDGAVAKPGVYVAKGETTLLSAIALAGGLGDVGDVDGVTVSRVVNGQRTATTYSLKSIRAGRVPDPPVHGRDTVSVADSATLTTLKFVRDLGGTAIGAARFVP